MKVLAIDPGLTTGIATWEDGEFTSLSMTIEQFYNLAHKMIDWADVVVFESYTITLQTLKKSRGENWSLELIGIIRYLADRYEKPILPQAPSDAMGFASNKKLRALDWYTPGPDHPNDAARHLLLYLDKRKLIDRNLFLDTEG